MKVNYSFLFYIFVAAVVIITALTKFNNSGRAWTATLCVILFTFVFIYFGYRWFQTKAASVLYDGPWPPIINMCPDYLVAVKRGNTYACVDIIGVNRSDGGLKSLTKDDNIQNTLATDKYFSMIFKPGMKKDELQGLCNYAMAKGVTWEGITNGESCTWAQSGSYAMAAAAGDTSNCPS